MWICIMLLNHTLKNGQGGKFYVMCVRYVPLSWLRLLATLWLSDVHSVLFSLLAQLLWTHAFGFFYSQPVSYLVFLFSRCLLFSQHYCLFQRARPSQDRPEAGQLRFCHVCPQRCFRLHLCHSLLAPVSGDPGYMYFTTIKNKKENL